MFPADNPQQSQSCSHVGLHGNCWCRRCKLGGTERDRETDENYEAHFSPGDPRRATETVQEVKAQIRAAALGVAKTVETMQTASGVKDPLAEYWIQILIVRAREMHQIRVINPSTRDPRLNARRLFNRPLLVNEIDEGIQRELLDWLVTQPAASFNALPIYSPLRSQLQPGDHFNSLLCLETGDIHRDTPVEILHTYLLGVDKYIWHHSHSTWTPTQCELFAKRLQSSSTSGLSIPPIRAAYMVQYRNGLIGKHFKTLQQLAIFHVDDALCSSLVRDLWKATGELGAILWYHEIADMVTYLADLEILVANVLDIWSLIDPQRIFVKPKLHILAHVGEDVQRHGPALLYSTEIFECFNAIFRMCSVLSNHQAPSRDIAWTCADLDRFKHQISGGWWIDECGDAVQAGVRVREYFHNVHVQRRLGYVTRSGAIAGNVRCLKKARQNPQRWSAFGLTLSPLGLNLLQSSEWYLCTSVTSRSGDCCASGSWVFVEHNAQTLVGRISHILTPTSATTQINAPTCVVIERFTLTNSCHPDFNMPELLKEDRIGEATHMALHTKDVLFIVNVQHNCRDGKCTASGRRPRRQERTDTEIFESFVEHADDKHFILNLHAIHNAALVRNILPRHLTAPVPYLTDRQAKHKSMAAELRAAHETRRKRDADARQARKEKRVAAQAVSTGLEPTAAAENEDRAALTVEDGLLGIQAVSGQGNGLDRTEG